MEIKLSKDAEQRLVRSIRRFWDEKLGEEVGDLKASLLLDFCLREIAPCVYNQAIADARAYMQDRLADLDGTCFAAEFTYWRKEPERGG